MTSTITKAQPQPLTPLGDAFSGAIGACFANTVTFPLDVVKTRIQAGVLYKEVARTGPNGKRIVIERRNRGLFEGVYYIAKGEEGVPGLFRGLGASTVNTFSMQFSYFYAYSYVRNLYIGWLTRRSPPGSKLPAIGTAVELILGALAGALAQLFTIPVAVIATRQQIAAKSSPTGDPSGHRPAGRTTVSGKPASSSNEDKTGALKSTAEKVAAKLSEDNSFMGVARDILKTDGITGLWRGLKPSLVLTVNPAITYGVFERVKTLVLATSTDGKMTPWRAFFIGALSKTLATIVTFPYILSKIRLQAKNTPYKGAIDVLTQIAKEKGIKGWYGGAWSQIQKAVLTQAILFAAKDYVTGVVGLMGPPFTLPAPPTAAGGQ